MPAVLAVGAGEFGTCYVWKYGKQIKLTLIS